MQHRPRNNPMPAHDAPRRSGFTIIELLIVVGVIIVLLSIVVVAVNSAMRTSQAANTQALMSSISQGLVQFRSDIGYLPPVLATPTTGNPLYKASRDYAPPPQSKMIDIVPYSQRIQDWYSITTIAEYLLGYGDATEVGYGANNPIYEDDEQRDGALGIRHPGSDGFWGVAVDPTNQSKPGTLALRQQHLEDHPSWRRYLQGRVYGPYFELRDDRLLGAVVEGKAPNPQTGQYQVYFPGDALPPGQTWDLMPKVIVDHWGQPVRYFRKPYMPGLPGQDIRRPQDGRLPSLSDVFALRPFRLPANVIDNEFADARGDTSTTATLNAASFALLSAGADRRLDRTYRADPEEYNRDNIVEIGR